ncbi:DedA family protein [Canibacter sp. lx-72]|nr:DedA family protein [Canibacter zhuwentaonis]MBT1035032.1 DedA family protein [Canibacter zhuwentaonis]
MNIIGAPGVGLGIAIENIFPPIPSEVLLPLAGFTAARPGANFGPIAATLWATAGSVLGALLLYYIGVIIGHDRIVKIANRLPLVKGSDITKTVAWFQRNGYKAVFFGRMLPIFRSLISIPAGMERMNLLAFTLLTTAGSLIWNAAFIFAGYFLGDNWELVSAWIDRFKYVIVFVTAVLVLLWIIRRVLQNTRSKKA